MASEGAPTAAEDAPDLEEAVRREAAADAVASADAGAEQSAAGAGSGAPSASESKGSATLSRDETIVMYIVLRKDLESLGWPQGAIVSQAAHAASAAMWLYRDDPHTVAYAKDLDHMHKVVLAAKSETQLRNTAAKLEANKVDHKLWIEQPENIATCIATKPYPRAEIAKLFSKLKLLR